MQESLSRRLFESMRMCSDEEQFEKNLEAHGMRMHQLTTHFTSLILDVQLEKPYLSQMKETELRFNHRIRVKTISCTGKRRKVREH